MANEVSALAWAAHQAAEEALAASQLPPAPAGFELGYSRGFLVATVTSRGVAAVKSKDGLNTGLAAAAPKDAARVAMGGAHELAERVWPIVDALRKAALLGEIVEVAAQESAEAALAWTP
jgi:hypothetical protein